MDGSEEVSFQAQREIESQQLRTDFKNLLNKFHQENQTPTDRQTKQNQIIDRLPADFWENYKGRLIGKDYEDEMYRALKVSIESDTPIQAAENPWEIISNDNRRTLKAFGSGELFESLVRADPEISRDPETKLATALRQFMTNPLRFELPVSHYYRNPDLAKVDDKGNITGWIECKAAGKLDARAIQQLQDGGFASSFQSALDFLKKFSSKTLKEHGLGDVAENTRSLNLSPTLSLTLAIPHTDVPVKSAGEIMGSDAPAETKSRAVKEIDRRYTIKQSPFSREELSCLNNFLIDKFCQEQGISHDAAIVGSHLAHK